MKNAKKPVSILLALLLLMGLIATLSMTAYAETTEPAVKTDLVYNGQPQPLINEGSTDEGTMLYSVGRLRTVYSEFESGTAYLDSNEFLVGDVVWPCKDTSTRRTIRFDGKTVMLHGQDDSLQEIYEIRYMTSGTLWYFGPSASNKVRTTDYNALLVTAMDETSVTVEFVLYSEDTIPMFMGDEWTASSPVRTDAGSYDVFYKIDGENPVEPTMIGTATIEKVTPTVSVIPVENLLYNGEEQALISSASTDFGTLQYGFSRTPVVYENCVVNIPDLKYGDILYVHDLGAITFEGEGTVKYNSTVLTRIAHGVETSWEVIAFNGGMIKYNYNDFNSVIVTSVSGGVVNVAYYKYNPQEPLAPAVEFWSEDIPKATEPGEYPLCYRVMGNGNVNDLPQVPITASIAEPYIVTWKNWDGTTLETDTGVEAGAIPSYDGETPTKPANVRYSYSFNGWSPEISAVTDNVSYTAQFQEGTARFRPGDSIDFGDSVYVKGCNYNDPTHELSGSYTFVSASFNSTERNYNVVLQSGDETLELTAYGYTEYETYVLQVSTGNGTSGNPYRFQILQLGTVIWKDEDGNILEVDENVVQGTPLSFDGTYSRQSESPDDYYYVTCWYAENNGVIDTQPHMAPNLGLANFEANGQRIYHGKQTQVKYVKPGVVFFQGDGMDCVGSYISLRTNKSNSMDIVMNGPFTRSEYMVVSEIKLYDANTQRHRYRVALSSKSGGTSFFYRNFEQALGNRIAWKCLSGEGTQEDPYILDFVSADLIIGHDISLEGNIGINFYLDPQIAGLNADQVTEDNLSYSFAWADEGGKVDVAAQSGHAFTVTNDGRIKVSCKVCAAEMTCDVKASFTLNGFPDSESYSVRQYCDTILDENSDFSLQYKADLGEARYGKLLELVKAMLHYGAMAQARFGINTANPANAGVEYEKEDVTGEMLDNAVKAANNGDTADDLTEVASRLGAKWYSTSLVYLSETTLRHYFTKDSDAFNPGDYDDHKGEYYYVEVSDIPAAELDSLQSFRVGSQSFRYSALDYVKAVINGSASAESKNLAKALYWYNQAANDYFHIHIPGAAGQENLVPATCTATGSYDEVVYCSRCGEELSRETKILEKTPLVYVPELPATHEAVGVAAHYECPDCGKLYMDAEANDEITEEDLILPRNNR